MYNLRYTHSPCTLPLNFSRLNIPHFTTPPHSATLTFTL